MEDGSNFEDGFPPTILQGFNNNELAEYFESYLRMGINSLDAEQQKKVLYLCGRHPGLLMKMRKELSYVSPEKWNIERIWYSNSGVFNTVYDIMCRQLQSDRVSRNKTTTLMDVLLYQFEFFSVEDEAYSEWLINAGFASEVPEEDRIVDATGVSYYPDIFVLSGETLTAKSNERLKCEPLSPYFLEYVKRRWSPAQEDGLAACFELTERALRVFLREKLNSRYGDTWEAIAESALPNKQKNYYLNKLISFATLNGYTGELSILDVMGFENYYAVIKNDWNTLFEIYFTKYGSVGTSTLSRLEEDFKFLTSCRNTNAHGNLKILNPQNAGRLEMICNSLNRIIDSK